MRQITLPESVLAVQVDPFQRPAISRGGAVYTPLMAGTGPYLRGAGPQQCDPLTRL